MPSVLLYGSGQVWAGILAANLAAAAALQEQKALLAGYDNACQQLLGLPEQPNPLLEHTWQPTRWAYLEHLPANNLATVPLPFFGFKLIITQLEFEQGLKPKVPGLLQRADKLIYAVPAGEFDEQTYTRLTIMAQAARQAGNPGLSGPRLLLEHLGTCDEQGVLLTKRERALVLPCTLPQRTALQKAAANGQTLPEEDITSLATRQLLHTLEQIVI